MGHSLAAAEEMEKKMSEITVIGGVVAEIEGNPYGQLMFADENSGTMSAYYSGTGRNIAENLGRLAADAAFFTAVGNDFPGKGAKRELEELSVDTSEFRIIDGQNTAMHMEILNLVGDLEMAVGNWDVNKCIDEKALEKGLDKLNQSKIVATDCVLPKEALTYLTDHVEVPLFLDPETGNDAQKCKELIGKFHTIAPNRTEAEAISGLEIFSEEQLMEAGQWFADQGVTRIFITMSGGGVYYKEGIKEGIIRPKEMLSMINGEGTGAAFSAAALDGFVKGMDVEETAKYAMAAAAVALEVKTAVNPNMSEEKVKDLVI